MYTTCYFLGALLFGISNKTLRLKCMSLWKIANETTIALAELCLTNGGKVFCNGVLIALLFLNQWENGSKKKKLACFFLKNCTNESAIVCALVSDVLLL